MSPVRPRLNAVVALCALAVLLGQARAGASDEAPPSGEPTPSPAPGWRLAPFSIENAATGLDVALTGYVQADLRSFPNWTVGDAGARRPASEWRRVRVGIDARWRRLRLQLDVAPVLEPGNELQDAWLDTRLGRALHLRVGHQKVPVSAEWLVSPVRTDMIERALAVDALAPERDWGVQLLGQIGRRLEYQGGVFAGDGSTSRSRAGTTLAGRFVWKPFAWMDLAGSASGGSLPTRSSGTEPTKGFEISGVSGYGVFAPVFVAGRRVRWGADVFAHQGSLALRGEYLAAHEARDGQGPAGESLPAVLGHGFALTGTWLVTGETKERTIRPRRRLPAGPGAIELAVRYEGVAADDTEDVGPEDLGPRARNLRPARLRALSGGISWWPASFARLLGNLVVERYGDALRAPRVGRAGNYVTLVARLQLTLP